MRRASVWGDDDSSEDESPLREVEVETTASDGQTEKKTVFPNRYIKHRSIHSNTLYDVEGNLLRHQGKKLTLYTPALALLLKEGAVQMTHVLCPSPAYGYFYFTLSPLQKAEFMRDRDRGYNDQVPKTFHVYPEEDGLLMPHEP